VLTLTGGPCVPTSGGPAANGASFPSFSPEKVLTPRIFGMFCKAVVQTVLLFGCESWTVTDAIWNVLKGFHHRAAGRMADIMAHGGPCGGWICPPLEEALKKPGLCAVEHCVNKRQQCTVDCISTRPVWMHCVAVSRKPGTSRPQDGLLVGSEEKAGNTCGRALGGCNFLSAKALSLHPPPPCLIVGQGPKPCKCFGGEDGSIPGNAPSSPSF